MKQNSHLWYFILVIIILVISALQGRIKKSFNTPDLDLFHVNPGVPRRLLGGLEYPSNLTIHTSFATFANSFLRLQWPTPEYFSVLAPDETCLFSS